MQRESVRETHVYLIQHNVISDACILHDATSYKRRNSSFSRPKLMIPKSKIDSPQIQGKWESNLKESSVTFLDAIREVDATEGFDVGDDTVAGVDALAKPFHELHQAASLHGRLHHHHEIVERHGCYLLSQ